jgi:drug/metabolite transporter (DMT)-like permease
MLTLTLAFGASVAWGASDFLGGLASRRMPVATVLFWAQLAGLVLAAAVWFAAGAPLPEARVALLAGIAGVAEVVGFALLYRGLAIGEMAAVAPLAALTAVLPVGVALGAGERVAALEAGGMALAVVGSVLTAGDPASRRLVRGAGFGLAAALAFGVFLLALGEASESGGVAAVLCGRVVSVAVLGAVLTARRTPPRHVPRGSHAAILATLGGLDVLANLAYAGASARRFGRRARARLALPADRGAAGAGAAARAPRPCATRWRRGRAGRRDADLPGRPAGLAASVSAHDAHEVGRARLVADDLGLDRALHGLQAGDLALQLLRAPLELADAALHPLELGFELEHALDAREVHPVGGGESLDAAQPLDVRVRVQARALRRALGLDQAARLVHAQRLGVHVGELGRDGDHEDTALAVDGCAHPCAPHGHHPRAASRRICSRGLPFMTLESSSTARRCSAESSPGTSITKR